MFLEGGVMQLKHKTLPQRLQVQISKPRFLAALFEALANALSFNGKTKVYYFNVSSNLTRAIQTENFCLTLSF
jgi:hypothetical protein